MDASTVGIVSDVDEDFGTLTVISGDVDGKVAKVTLNASQVTNAGVCGKCAAGRLRRCYAGLQS